MNQDIMKLQSFMVKMADGNIGALSMIMDIEGLDAGAIKEKVLKIVYRYRDRLKVFDFENKIT